MDGFRDDGVLRKGKKVCVRIWLGREGVVRVRGERKGREGCDAKGWEGEGMAALKGRVAESQIVSAKPLSSAFPLAGLSHCVEAERAQETVFALENRSWLPFSVPYDL